MPPKLSIQIALHNRKQFIKDSVLSALHCGYENTEIVVIDDASNDNSGDVVTRLAGEYPGKIKYLRSEENLGCARARAAMVNASSSEYVMILDDDDVLLPFDIAAELDFLDKNPAFAVSSGKIIPVDKELKPIASPLGCSFSRFTLFYWNPVMHTSAIVRRSALLDAGNYLPAGTENIARTVATDLFLWSRIATKYNFRFDNNFRVLYRQHSVQLTSNKDAYLEAANFIHRYLVDNNKDLYERICSSTLTVTSLETKTAVLLLSIVSRYMPPESPQRLQVLNAAGNIAPDDYGVNLLKFDYFFEQKKYATAVTEAEKVFYNSNLDSHVRSLALEKILSVCKITGAPNIGELTQLLESLKDEYAAYAPVILKKYFNKESNQA